MVKSIAKVISNSPGIELRDFSADPDHNRGVMTFLGNAEAIHVSAMAAVDVAIDRIDMNRHTGVHPRIGAVDVLPIIPLRGGSREIAVNLSRKIGYEMAAAYDLPVYFYEWASLAGRPSALPELRRNQFEQLKQIELIGDLAPDAGPTHIHPTAGASVVGARGLLVAYNINLMDGDDSIAKRIAARIRIDRDVHSHLAGVRALGLYLPSKGLSQVSMNLTLPYYSCLPTIFEYVRKIAQDLGIKEVVSEIIGVIPPSALGSASPESIAWLDFRPAQILPFEPEIFG